MTHTLPRNYALQSPEFVQTVDVEVPVLEVDTDQAQGDASSVLPGQGTVQHQQQGETERERPLQYRGPDSLLPLTPLPASEQGNVIIVCLQ